MSAVRNLAGKEVNGRPLRIDSATNAPGGEFRGVLSVDCRQKFLKISLLQAVLLQPCVGAPLRYVRYYVCIKRRCLYMYVCMICTFFLLHCPLDISCITTCTCTCTCRITGYFCEHDIYAIMRVKVKSQKYHLHNLYLCSIATPNVELRINIIHTFKIAFFGQNA